MPRYGFELSRGEWQGEADTLADAIALAERETGSAVQRGRCLDHYTEPTPGEYIDYRAFMAANRAMNARARGRD